MLAGTESDALSRLKSASIQPSAQRLLIASYVLFTKDHPSAEQVLRWVRSKEGESATGAVSRATIYNTLNLFVERGLLKELVIHEGHSVFDPELTPHPHFFDLDTGEILDLSGPIGLDLASCAELDDVDVEEVQVVLRGRRKHRGEGPPSAPN